MTELHIWVYVGLAVLTLQAALFWFWMRSRNDAPNVSHRGPIMLMMLPVALYIGGVGLRIFVYVITWLIRPIIGAL